MPDQPNRRMMDDPQVAELVRRFDEFIAEFRDWRRQTEITYVRADVYRAEQTSDRAVARDLRADLDAIAAQRQKMVYAILTSLILPVIAGVVVALVLAGGSR